jgi:hypothetical protein
LFNATARKRYACCPTCGLELGERPSTACGGRSHTRNAVHSGANDHLHHQQPDISRATTRACALRTSSSRRLAPVRSAKEGKKKKTERNVCDYSFILASSEDGHDSVQGWAAGMAARGRRRGPLLLRKACCTCTTVLNAPTPLNLSCRGLTPIF